MKVFRGALAVLCMAALCFSGPLAAAEVANLNRIKEGDALPAFTGRNLDGDTVDVGKLIGEKVVVLAFWSIYCKPCVEEISSLIRLQEEHGGPALEVISINADGELGVSRIRTFVSRFEEFEKKQINYEIIYDENNALSQLLGVGFLPTVLSINLEGKVERMFVGFEEQSEEEIFVGIKALLPSANRGDPYTEEDIIYDVEAVVPLCGFYGPEGWKGSFSGNRDLDKEKERVAEMARSKATKLILREALIKEGVRLAEDVEADDCFQTYGVNLLEDPMNVRDNLTNLMRELPLNRLVSSLGSEEDFQGREFRVREKATVNVDVLRNFLENLDYRTTPQAVTFSIVNINKLDQSKFEKLLVQQSRYIGTISFPTFTIYTTAEIFAEEMEDMDLEGLKLFIEETTEDSIELEVWR